MKLPFSWAAAAPANRRAASEATSGRASDMRGLLEVGVSATVPPQGVRLPRGRVNPAGPAPSRRPRRAREELLHQGDLPGGRGAPRLEPAEVDAVRTPPRRPGLAVASRRTDLVHQRLHRPTVDVEHLEPYPARAR